MSDLKTPPSIARECHNIAPMAQYSVAQDAPLAYLNGMKIVRTQRYLKDMKRVGASEQDIVRLERSIAADPAAGAVIKGLGGVRKIRFGLANRGKRGGGRAIYFLLIAEDTAIMLFAYAKNEQEDLSPEQRKAVLAMLKELDNG